MVAMCDRYSQPVRETALQLVEQHAPQGAIGQCNQRLGRYAWRSKAKGYQFWREVKWAVEEIERDQRQLEIARQHRLADLEDRRAALASKLIGKCDTFGHLQTFVLDAGNRLIELIDAEAMQHYEAGRYGKMHETYNLSTNLGLFITKVNEFASLP